MNTLVARRVVVKREPARVVDLCSYGRPSCLVWSKPDDEYGSSVTRMGDWWQSFQAGQRFTLEWVEGSTPFRRV